MKKQNTGGRAFPVDCVVERDEEGRMHGFEVSSGGMTLRDYFAAKAMSSLCNSLTPEAAAKDSYEYADAMLRARESS